MKYLLDTCVVSDFVKGEPGTLKKIKKISPNEIAVSSITVMEIQYGLLLNPQRVQVITPIIEDFLNNITIFNYAKDDAYQTAKIRTSLRQAGKIIGSYDLLIAGSALCHQLILVTANTDEFERISELRIENWRKL